MINLPAIRYDHNEHFGFNSYVIFEAARSVYEDRELKDESEAMVLFMEREMLGHPDREFFHNAIMGHMEELCCAAMAKA